MLKKKGFNPLPAELRKLGLNSKEAEIYLYLLDKKSATVLNISKATSLSRPTVYRTLQYLLQKELVFNGSNKKNFFSASSPNSFLKILRVQRRKAQEQEREFLRIISVLQSKYYLLSKKNEIRVFQIKAALEDFSNTAEKDIRVFCLDNKSFNCEKISRVYLPIKKRLGKISVRELYANSPKNIGASFDFIERKILQKNPEFSFDALIITDKIFLFGKKQTLCIEEESIVEFFRIIFDLLWSVKD